MTVGPRGMINEYQPNSHRVEEDKAAQLDALRVELALATRRGQADRVQQILEYARANHGVTLEEGA